MVISLRPPGQTEEEKGSVKGEKTETDWLLLSKDLHFSNEGSNRANSHKLVVPSHPTLPIPMYSLTQDHRRTQQVSSRITSYQYDEARPQSHIPAKQGQWGSRTADDTALLPFSKILVKAGSTSNSPSQGILGSKTSSHHSSVELKSYGKSPTTCPLSLSPK